MKGLWYGDRRDRVKWGALVHLARSHGISQVVQVAYYRQGELPTLNADQPVEMSPEVWNHFSDLKQISRLAQACGLSISMVDSEFVPARRREYVSQAISCIRALRPPRIVFLDPDTGLGTKPEHVTHQDAVDFWQSLESGDLLVLYQHADHTKTWREKRSGALSRACSGSSVEAITGPGVAKDVAILWCEKR